MSEILTQNLAVIRQRWPALAARLEAEVADHLTVELIQGQEETLRVNDIQLTSRHGRFAEARLQAGSLPGCKRAACQAPARQRMFTGQGWATFPAYCLRRRTCNT